MQTKSSWLQGWVTWSFCGSSLKLESKFFVFIFGKGLSVIDVKVGLDVYSILNKHQVNC